MAQHRHVVTTWLNLSLQINMTGNNKTLLYVPLASSTNNPTMREKDCIVFHEVFTASPPPLDSVVCLGICRVFSLHSHSVMNNGITAWHR